MVKGETTVGTKKKVKTLETPIHRYLNVSAFFLLAHSSCNPRSEIDHHHLSRRSFSLLAIAFKKISAHLRMLRLNLQRNWPN